MIAQHPDRAAWLAARGEGYGLGGSDIPAILGVPGHRGAWDVWAAHHRPDMLDQSDDASKQRGRRLEPIIAAWLAESMPGLRWYDNATVSRDDVPWARYSPDAITADGVPVEIKTDRNSRRYPDGGHLSIDDPLPREDYPIQAVWQSVVEQTDTALLVVAPLGNWLAGTLEAAIEAGADDAVLSAILRANCELKVYTLDTPKPLRDALLVRVAEWREAHLVAGVEPDRDASEMCKRVLGAPVEDPGDDLIEGDDNLLRLVDKWQDAAKSADAAKAEADAARLEVMAALRSVPGARWGDFKVKWRNGGGGETVSVGSVKKKCPDLYAALVAAGLVSERRQYRYPAVSGGTDE